MNNKSIALIMVTLLVGSSLAGMGLVQATDNVQQSAETMLTILETSHEEVSNLFDLYTGIIPEDAQESYDEAVELKSQAQEDYDLGNYEESVELAVDALNEYGKAAEKLYKKAEAQQTGEPEDEEIEHHLGLYVAQEQSIKRLEKRIEIAFNLEGQGLEVSTAWSLLDDAKDMLVDEMGQALEEGEYESAAKLLGEANSLIGQSTGELKRAGHPKKMEKTKQFIAETTKLVLNLEAKISRILEKSDLTDEEQQEILDQFKEIKDKLDGIDLNEEENLKQVIDELQDIIKDTQNIGKGKSNKGGKVFESLKTITRHESKIDRYRIKIENLNGLGVDTSELEALLAEAEEGLGNALSGAENEEGVEDLMDQIEDLLDDIDDLIDALEEEVNDQGKHGNN